MKGEEPDRGLCSTVAAGRVGPCYFVGFAMARGYAED